MGFIQASRAGQAMRSRAGFTLVEIVVALLVLSAGLLGAVSVLRLTARTVTAAAQRTAAGVTAAARLELWLGTRCGGTAAADPGGADWSWTVTGLGNSVASATVITAPDRVRPDTFSITGGC